VLGRLRHDAYASFPFVAFLTPPAGRLDSCSIGPALSRPYRRSPLCSRSISTSSPGIRACSVCRSASRTSPDTKGPGNFPRRSGNRRHKECMQYSPTWYSVDRRPNRQGYTATLARPHGRRRHRMTCSFCGQPLISALERTRLVCASCHVLSRQSGSQRAGGHSATTPPQQISPGEILDSTAAPPTPLDDQSPAQADVTARDSSGSNTSEETGLSR
jgi:hypothetical protein